MNTHQLDLLPSSPIPSYYHIHCAQSLKWLVTLPSSSESAALQTFANRHGKAPSLFIAVNAKGLPLYLPRRFTLMCERYGRNLCFQTYKLHLKHPNQPENITKETKIPTEDHSSVIQAGKFIHFQDLARIEAWNHQLRAKNLPMPLHDSKIHCPKTPVAKA